MISGLSATEGKSFIPIQSINSPKFNAGEGSFRTEVSKFINEVNSTQIESQDASMKLATGQSRNVHEALISMEKASLSLQFAGQVRNKAVEAYQEIMRMQM